LNFPPLLNILWHRTGNKHTTHDVYSYLALVHLSDDLSSKYVSMSRLNSNTAPQQTHTEQHKSNER